MNTASGCIGIYQPEHNNQVHSDKNQAAKMDFFIN